MRLRSTLGLVSCGTLFGLTYVLVRIAVPVVGPVLVTCIRTLIGGATLLAVGALRGHLARLRDWRGYLLLGALSSALPFTLISVSMLVLDAGSAAVLNASSPVFALAIDAVFRRRLPTRSQLVGVVVATVGVVVVMAGRGVHIGRADATGILSGLGGAAAFAYGAFFAARRFPTSPPLSVAAGQQLAACALLVPVLALEPAPGPFTAEIRVCLVLLGFVGSALAYLLFYWLIAAEGPARAANVNLIVPATGVLWGWLILREPVAVASFAGMALTVGGLILILRRPAKGGGAVSPEAV